jgi:hypothetical protein
MVYTMFNVKSGAVFLHRVSRWEEEKFNAFYIPQSKGITPGVTQGGPEMKNVCILVTSLMLSLGLTFPANASFITVDEYVYASGDLTPVQAQNLSANVDMTWNASSGLLTITLTNTSGLTSGTTATASNVLTGLGFNLPAGVTLLNTSNIALPGGSSISSGEDLNQNMWGWDSGIKGGHFYTVPDISVNTAVSAMSADSSITFGGQSHDVLDGVDYGLLSGSGSPGPGGKNVIESSIVFYLYLSGVPTDYNLLSYIDSSGVVAEFGSPNTIAKTPLPVTIYLLASGLAGLVALRRKTQKPSAN